MTDEERNKSELNINKVMPTNLSELDDPSKMISLPDHSLLPTAEETNVPFFTQNNESPLKFDDTSPFNTDIRTTIQLQEQLQNEETKEEEGNTLEEKIEE